jgi:hypothetical protein
MRTWWGVVVVVLLVSGGAMAKKKPLPAACPGGRFPLAGTPLVPGGATPDAIEITGTQVSIDSGCALVTAHEKRTRTGTRLLAHWKKGCGSLKGPVELVLKLSAPACDSLAGRFKSRSVRRRLSSQAEVPSDSFGRAGDQLPPGAVLLTQAEWDQAKQRPDFRSVSPQQVAADRAVEDQNAAADSQVITDYLSMHPDLMPQLMGGVDPNDSAVAPGDGGEYLLTFQDRTGNPRTVSTLGSRGRNSLLAKSLTNFPTFPNQLSLYTEYYNGLLALIGSAPPGPTPDQAAHIALTDLVGLNASLAAAVYQYVPLVPPPGGFAPAGYPSSCSAEEGAGDGLDRTDLCSHTSGGVWQNYVWGLKWDTTCVKDQGRRGTCWAFATVASTEVWVAKKYNRWVNLSEQDLIFSAKHLWYPSVYGDEGGPPLDAIHDTGYTFPFENQWEYNQSRSRTSNDTTQTYTNSCLGYGGPESAYCSDTNHQGQLVCFDLLLFRFCAAIGPTILSTSGFAPTSWTWFWDPTNPDNSFATLVWALAIFQKPVIVGLPVTPSFDGPNANGYMTYRGPHCPVDGAGHCTPGAGCECDRGGHVTIVTGLIDNSQLPAGAPLGDGGGYVIMKNSWGTCYGDAGYVYVPYSWFKAMVGSAGVIGDIN